jgi:hypothetical protein
MHSAPAVSYPVGRSHFQGCLLGGSVLIGVLAGMLWFYVSGLAGWRLGLYAITLVGTGALAIQTWRRTPGGVLRWDGQAWRWTTDAASVNGVLTVHLDFQFCLLLSLQTDAGVRLALWPQRQTDAAHWHALRCAVFSHQRKVAVLATLPGADFGGQSS